MLLTKLILDTDYETFSTHLQIKCMLTVGQVLHFIHEMHLFITSGPFR